MIPCMRAIIRSAVLGAAMVIPVAALAQWDRITNQEAVAGLRSALEKGAQAAVGALGKNDGFMQNAKVKIPLPESVRSAERMMRRVGMGSYADELILSMNRAAEQATPEARQLLVDSVKKMSVQDAKGILTGGDTAGTDYFKRTTLKQLHERFLPIVSRATAKVGVAQKYNEYAGRGVVFGLLSKEDANLDEYVTRKALDGLYLMIAEEEKRIRKDPVGAGTDILKKVFGALR